MDYCNVRNFKARSFKGSYEVVSRREEDQSSFINIIVQITDNA